MPRRFPISRARLPDVLLVCACFVVACIVAVRWAHPGKVVYYQDLFWLYDPWNFLHKQLFVWNDYFSLEGRYRFGLLLWPYFALLSALSTVFGDSIGQMIAVGLAHGASWAAMFVLLRVLRFSRLPAMIGATGFAWNPWMQAIIPVNYAVQWCVAAGAIAAALLVASSRYPQYRKHCMFAMALVAAVPAAVVAANLGMLLIFILFLVFGFALAAQSTGGDARAFRQWAVWAALAMGVCTLWWIVPTSFEYLLSAPAAATNAASVAWVVRRASFDNLLRLQPLWNWGTANYYAYAQAYDANPLTYASGFALVSLSVLALKFRTAERAALVRLGLAFALIMLFLAKGLHEPLAWINELTYKLPGSAVWREPTTKFPPIAFAGLAVCVAALFEGIRFPDRRLRAVAGGLIVAAFGISTIGLLDGRSVYPAETLGLPSSYVALPSYWREAAGWLNAQPDDGMALVLPPNAYYQTSYVWGLTAVDLLPGDLIARQTSLLGSIIYTAAPTDQHIWKYLTDAFAARPRDLAPMLRSLGVRYVLFRGDVFLPGTPSESAGDVGRYLPHAAVRAFGPLSIFDVGPATPLAGTNGDWIEGDYAGRSVADQLETVAMLEDLPRVDQGEARGRVASAPLVRELDPLARAGLDGGAAVRYVWSSGLKGFSAPLPPHQRFAAEIWHRPDLDSRTRVAIKPAAPTGAAGAERLSLSVAGVESIETAGVRRTSWSVFNPAASIAAADIEVAVAPSRATRYVLSANQQLLADDLAASGGVVWASFPSVLLRPGLSLLTLTQTPAASGRSAEPQLGARFGDLRAHPTAFAAADAARRQNGPGFVLGMGGPSDVAVATIPLTAPLAGRPELAFRADPHPAAAALGVLVDFTFEGTPYRCYALPEYAGETYYLDLTRAVVDCLNVAGVPAGQDAVRAATIRGAQIDAALPQGVGGEAFLVGIHRVDVTWTPGADATAIPRMPRIAVAGDGSRVRVDAIPADVSTGVAGYPPLALHRTPLEFGGIYPLLATAPARDEFVRLRQSYSRFWLGICLGSCPLFPAHLHDGSTWNAWWVPGRGTFLLTNELVVVQWLTALASFATLLLLALRLLPPRKRGSHV